MLSALLLLLLGCRTETLIEDNQSQNPKNPFHLTSKTISVKESRHKDKLLPEIKNAEVEIEAKTKVDAKGKVINYGNGVFIDTDNVTYIENGPNYHTYTFNIIREGAPANAPVENLLLTPLPDGSYREFLVTYHFTEQEKEAILSGSNVDSSGKTTVTELEKGTFGNPLAKSTSCTFETVEVIIPCTSTDHHLPGQNCKLTENDAPKSYTLVALVCSDDPENPGSGTPPPPGGSSGGGGSIDGDPKSDPKDPPCETTAPTSPQPGLTDGNGCSIGIPTQPILTKPYSLIVRKLAAINADAEFYSGLETYYNANNQSSEAETFIRWADQFKVDNPNVTWTEFENWFLTKSEGQDFFYDSNYWEDPNLDFQKQNLPSWNAFSSAYPNESSAQLYGVVGGAVAQAQKDYPIQTVNGCALKVSRALNYSGVVIPNIPGKTLKGADNKFYFLNAKALNAWMRKTFGTSPTNPKHKNFTKLDGGNNGQNFPNLFKNKKGIFSLVSPPNSSWASGHADILYLNGTCKTGCHFFDGDILYIDFWELN